ncbi:MAG: undecaprenyl-diphosphatase [Luteibaculaceae bacterium]|jgi:undecaprenyl-diphosphatase
MNYWEALLLGLIQGLTEFLPVSSSGHIELAKGVFGTEIKEGLLTTVVLHAGTALSTIFVFRKDILELISGVFRFEKPALNFALLIVISMIPAGVIGILFEDELEALFSGNLFLVGWCLLITGVLLFVSERVPSGTEKVGIKQAVIIGLAQAFAILPGVSRSGSTIATGLLLKVDKEKATRFSFLMVLPVIIGATGIKALKIDEATMAGLDLGPLLLAFVASFLAGWVACVAMLKIVKKKKLVWFALYCGLVGTLGIMFG